MQKMFLCFLPPYLRRGHRPVDVVLKHPELVLGVVAEEVYVEDENHANNI